MPFSIQKIMYDSIYSIKLVERAFSMTSSFVIVFISCESAVSSCARLPIEREDGTRKFLSIPNEFPILCICWIFHVRGCLAHTPVYTLDRTEQKKPRARARVFNRRGRYRFSSFTTQSEKKDHTHWLPPVIE